MYDMSRITGRLYCGAHVSAEDLSDIKRAGITHVIDCETDDEGSIFSDSSGVLLLPCPTADDGQSKSATWFAPGIAFGVSALGQPRFKVLTHCAAGVNRGPSMAYAIMTALGWEDALSIIRQHRPQAQARYWSDADSALGELGWTS